MKKNMRGLLPAILLCAVMLLSAPAVAEIREDERISDALLREGVSRPLRLSQWGDTVVCCAETDDVKRLILLEKKDGAWRIVIDNPTALIQDGDWPEIWLDSDSAVFWTYTLSDTEIVRYHSSRDADGTWGPVDQYYADSGFGEYTHVWLTLWDDAHGGEIVRTFSISDENDNDRGIQMMQVLPATWMTDCVRLADFDITRFPTPVEPEFGTWFGTDRFFREAAAALMPDQTYVRGILKDGAMHFLMDKPDGSRVYVVCEYESHRQVNLIESTPLPAGTVLGWENFSDSLRIDGCCVAIRLLHSGKAGLEYIYDDKAGEDAFLYFGDRAVWQDPRQETILYGDHPWGDISLIDWTALPRTRFEASREMDAGPYAVVLNPDPKDRLNLREEPDRGSRSLGKYYNGTPVTVLSEQGEWAEVSVGGRRGWMMKEYLDFGRGYDGAFWLDTLPMPRLSARDDMLRVYAEPQDGAYTYRRNADGTTMKVIGVIGDEWVHVWFPGTGEYGFVKRSDLWEGNG